MPLQKIEQPQLFKTHAYEEIKNAIIHHVIPQGALLSERDLSEKMGISRTPLREAINLLEMGGWVRSVPRKGILVSYISTQDVEEVLHLRRANEKLAVELAIPQIEDRDIAELEEMYQQQVENQSDHRAFIEIDKDFHMFIAKLSKNQRLTQLMEALSDHMRWVGVFIHHNIDRRAETTLKEHLAIVEGLKARDLEQAQRAVHFHIERTRASMLTAIQLRKGNENEESKD